MSVQEVKKAMVMDRVVQGKMTAAEGPALNNKAKEDLIISEWNISKKE